MILCAQNAVRPRAAVPGRAEVGLFTVLLIGVAAWLSILVVVVAMCRAAAHADGKSDISTRTVDRAGQLGTTAAPEAPAPGAVLIHN